MTDAEPAAPQDAPEPSALLLLAVGVLAASTSAILVRLADAPALVVSAWRCSVATIVLAFWHRRALARDLRRITRADLGWTVLAGVLLAGHFATWIRSLDLASVSSAVFLVNTSPLWIGLLGPLLTHDRISRATGLGLLLSLGGTSVIAAGSQGGGQDTPAGLGLALAGALTVALYMLVGRRVGERVPLSSYLVLCYGSAAAVLLGLVALSGDPLLDHPPATIGWLLALAAVPQLIGHSACNWALRRLPAVFVSLAFLGEPLVASGLALVVLREAPPSATLWGGPLVLLGIAVAARGQRDAG